MNSPQNARLALRRPLELVPQPEAGDLLEVHCGRRALNSGFVVSMVPPGGSVAGWSSRWQVPIRGRIVAA